MQMNWSAFRKKTDNCQFFKANSAFKIFQSQNKAVFQLLETLKIFQTRKKPQEAKEIQSEKSSLSALRSLDFILETGCGDLKSWESFCQLVCFIFSRCPVQSTLRAKGGTEAQPGTFRWDQRLELKFPVQFCHPHVQNSQQVGVCCPCPFPEPQQSPGPGAEGVNDKKKFIMCSHCSLSAGISEAAFDKMAGAKFSMCRLEVKCN